MKNLVFLVLILGGCLIGNAQNPTPNPYRSTDPIGNMSADINKISRSVETLSGLMKSFIEKFEKIGGLTMTEKQQKLILGMELLSRTEQRVVTFQKALIELTEKYNASKSRLSQVESDMRPRNINNSTAFEGTTETVELRESRRERLESERLKLIQLLSQIQNNLNETSDILRDAQSLAERLRRTFLPQIERELYDQ